MRDLSLSVSHREGYNSPCIFLRQLKILHGSWRSEYAELGECKGILLGYIGDLDTRHAVLLIDGPLCVGSDSSYCVFWIGFLPGKLRGKWTPVCHVCHPLDLLIEELFGSLDS